MGRKSLANAFALSLLCEKGMEEPCMQCHACKQVLSGNHPDLIYVTHEKPASIGVDDIREQINDTIQVRPYSSYYKIYIVDEAEKMTVQAQNALLKTIEEPPAYAVILLLTTNQDAFLPTILSRCVQLKLKPLKDSVVKEYLIQSLGENESEADIYAAFARGNLGKAIHLAQSEVGTQVHNIELYPGKGGQLVRSAGNSAQLMAKEGKYATLRLPSGEMRMVPIICRATIGVVGNGEHSLINIGKAGRKRNMGIRPTVRGSVMNPNDHPHGGGEGKCGIGRPGPCTPWGKPALGLKTRKKNKQSNKLIVRRRDGRTIK